jgi:hypothetical protein
MPNQQTQIHHNPIGSLKYLLNSTLTVEDAFGELIDNSLQYGGKNIKLTVKPGLIQVTDDGQGPPTGKTHEQLADIIFALGDEHLRLSDLEHAVGQFSFGMKDTIGRFGGRCGVFGVNAQGNTFGANCDYHEQIKAGKTFVTPTRCIPGTPYFTVEFYDVPPSRMPQDLEGLTKWLSRTYAKALRKGRSISLNGERLTAGPLPSFKEKCSIQVQDFLDGKEFLLSGGIIDDATHALSLYEGYDVNYGLRTFVYGYKANGCFGEYMPYRIWFDIQLINNGTGRWEVTRNKNNAIELPLLYKKLLENPQIVALLKEAQIIRHKTKFQGLSVGDEDGNTKREQREGGALPDGDEVWPPKVPKEKVDPKPIPPVPPKPRPKPKPRKPTHKFNLGSKGMHRIRIPGIDSTPFGEYWINHTFRHEGKKSELIKVEPDGETVCVIFNTDLDEGKFFQAHLAFAHSYAVYCGVTWAMKYQPQAKFLIKKHTNMFTPESLIKTLNVLLPRYLMKYHA